MRFVLLCFIEELITLNARWLTRAKPNSSGYETLCKPRWQVAAMTKQVYEEEAALILNARSGPKKASLQPRNQGLGGLMSADGCISNMKNGDISHHVQALGEEQRKRTAAWALAWTAGPKGSGRLVHTNAVIPLTEGEHIQRTLCATLKGKTVLSGVPST